MVNLQSRSPTALKELLTVGTFEAQTIVHLGVSRYKWKNVVNEFSDLFSQMMATLKQCEYLNTKVQGSVQLDVFFKSAVAEISRTLFLMEILHRFWTRTV